MAVPETLDTTVQDRQAGHLNDHNNLHTFLDAYIHPSGTRFWIPSDFAGVANPTFTGVATAPILKASGATALSAVRLVGSGAAPPTAATGTAFLKGDLYAQTDDGGFTLRSLWLCHTAGTGAASAWEIIPGNTWVNTQITTAVDALPDLATSDPSKFFWTASAGVSTADVSNLERKLIPTAVTSAAWTASVGELVRVSPTGFGQGVTLPADPEQGAVLAVKMVAQSAANVNCTVTCGGSDRLNIATTGPTSFIIDVPNTMVFFRYSKTDHVWLTRTIPPATISYFVEKTADTVRNNTATRTIDNHLAVAITPGTFRFEALLITLATTTADVGFHFNAPGSSTATWSMIGPPSTNNTAGAVAGSYEHFPRALGSAVAIPGTNTQKVATWVKGLLKSGSYGDFSVSWAQSVAEVSDATMYGGSFLWLDRLPV